MGPGVSLPLSTTDTPTGTTPRGGCVCPGDTTTTHQGAQGGVCCVRHCIMDANTHLKCCFVTCVSHPTHGSGCVVGRSISTGHLHTLLCFQIRPINPIIYGEPQQKPHLETGFPLRCFQRLSLPYVANQPCSWRNNWHTRGTSVPVLSY
jgi:hypothetical protein